MRGSVAGMAEAGTVRASQVGQHALFVLLAVICTVRALTAGTPWPAQLAATGLLVAWYTYGAHRAAAGGQRSTRAGQAWLAVLVLGWVGLVALSPENVWLAFSLWLLAGHLLPLGAALAVSLVILLVVVLEPVRQAGSTTFPAVIGPAVGSLIALGVARAQGRLVRDVVERQRLISSLVAAQEETAALTDELARTQHEAGALAERTRLSRDIHDTLAQGFSSILLLARGRGDELDPQRAAQLLAQIETTAAEGLDEARRVVGALAPRELEDDGLAAALRRLVARLREEVEIDGDVFVDGALPPLPTVTEVALLRTAQSALANVRLHSGAGRVVVSLGTVSDPSGRTSVRLDIVDDGRGFDAAAWQRTGLDQVSGSPLRGGYGIAATAARLRELGGSLEVESAPGEGTALAASLPLGHPRDGQESP